MTIAFALAVIATAAALNLLRGGAFGAAALPGHPRYLAASAVAVLALLVLEPLRAAGFGIAFLAWAWLPWGRWFDLGRLPDDYVDQVRPPSWFERLVGLVPSDAGRLLLRNLVGLAPGAILVGAPLVWALFAVLQVAAYEVGWRLFPKAPVRFAEVVVGAMWGGLLVGLGHA